MAGPTAIADAASEAEMEPKPEVEVAIDFRMMMMMMMSFIRLSKSSPLRHCLSRRPSHSHHTPTAPYWYAFQGVAPSLIQSRYAIGALSELPTSRIPHPILIPSTYAPSRQFSFLFSSLIR